MSPENAYYDDDNDANVLHGKYHRYLHIHTIKEDHLQQEGSDYIIM